MKSSDSLDFTAFYKHYRAYIRALCLCRVTHQSDADDLESVVWYDVHRYFSRFEEKRDPRGLLFQLVSWRATNLYKSHRRDKQFTVEDETLLDILERKHDTSSSSLDDRLALSELLLLETPEDRQILFGRYLEGMTWEELASRHGLHRNTVWQRTEALLSRLRQRWKPRPDLSEPS